jgi:hypothetical protein
MISVELNKYESVRGMLLKCKKQWKKDNNNTKENIKNKTKSINNTHTITQKSTNNTKNIK